MIKAAVFLLSAGMMLVPRPLSAQQDTISLNTELSNRYTQIAYEELRRQRLNEAEELIESALVFWPLNPDALFMQARIATQDNRYDQALELLPKVFSGYPLQYFTQSEALKFYLRSLLRHDETSQALMVISMLPPETAANRELLEFKAIALDCEGMDDILMETLVRGVRLYPESDILQAMLAGRSANYRRVVKQRVLAEEEGYVYGQRTIRILIKEAPVPEEKRRLLDTYTQRWGEDQFVRVHSLALDEEIDSNRVGYALENTDGITEELLSVLWNILKEKKQTELFQQAFKNFNGSVRRDPDADGFYEIEEIYEDGFISTVRADLYGVHVSISRLDFSGGIPTGFVLKRDDGSTVEGEYRRYPEMKSVRIPGGSNTVLDIELVPYSVNFPIRGWSDYQVPYPVPIPDVKEFPELHTFLQNAALIRTVNENKVKARFNREAGSVELLEGDTVKIRSELLGEKVTERRRDPDGDGFFEIREYYQSGQLVRITFDGNDNNIPEYVEDYGEMIDKMWDIDEDGIADYRRRESRN